MFAQKQEKLSQIAWKAIVYWVAIEELFVLKWPVQPIHCEKILNTLHPERKKSPKINLLLHLFFVDARV